MTAPTCPTGKHPYLTWTRASHDARALRRSGKRRDAHPYPCPCCKRFHVGGNP